MSRWPRPTASTVFYVFIALFVSAPAWIVKHPPLQDLPFHLATIRIIRSFHDPAFGFDRDFVLALGRTQYIVYYLLAAAISYVTGVVAANVVLVSVYFGGTILGLRALLKALGRDERLCLLAVPLLVNVMLMYALLPFLFGIPLMLWALATAVEHFERPTMGTGVRLTVLALGLFYSHIFPFGIFAIGYAALFPWPYPGRWFKAIAPALPALAFLLWWLAFTDAGHLVRGAALDNSADPKKSIDAAMLDIPNWLTNVFRDNSDEITLIGLALLVIATLGLSLGDPDGGGRRGVRAYVLLPMACVVLYFMLPEGHGYIWLIAQRFPILFAILAIPLLRMPRGARGGAVFAGAIAVAVFSTVNTCKHFIEFEKDEVGDVDGAIAAMEPRSRVCALIYDKTSSIMNNQPFLHFGSYYQLQDGGVVMFTYAGYAHWPVQFQPGRYPPQGAAARQRWEWTPEQVSMNEIFPYYDYVLTRGNGFRPPPGTYHVKWRGDRWTVWAKG